MDRITGLGHKKIWRRIGNGAGVLIHSRFSYAFTYDNFLTWLISKGTDKRTKGQNLYQIITRKLIKRVIISALSGGAEETTGGGVVAWSPPEPARQI